MPASLPSVSFEFAPEARCRLIESYGKLPLRFEANDGQTDERVKILARGRGYMLFLISDEAVFSLHKPSPVSPQLSADRNLKFDTGNSWIGDGASAISGLPSLLPKRESLALPLHHPESSVDPSPRPGTPRPEPAVLRMKLVGANPDVKVTGVDLLPGKSNYFIGNHPKAWRTNVSNYARVKYEGVYPGIDLVYYGNHRQLEYDLVVSPGADPQTIRFADAGNSKLEIRNWKIETRTSTIGICLRTPNSKLRIPRLSASTRTAAWSSRPTPATAGDKPWASARGRAPAPAFLKSVLHS